MPHQTPMTPEGRRTPTEGVRSGFAGLLHDVTTLAELQFQLLAVDAEEASRRAALPLILIGAAAVFGLSALPLLLLALAQFLRDQAGWPPALATLVAVAIGLLTAGILGAVGALKLKSSLEPFARSRDELNRNVAWLKSALKREAPETSPPSHAAAAESPKRPR